MDSIPRSRLYHSRRCLLSVLCSAAIGHSKNTAITGHRSERHRNAVHWKVNSLLTGVCRLRRICLHQTHVSKPFRLTAERSVSVFGPHLGLGAGLFHRHALGNAPFASIGMVRFVRHIAVSLHVNPLFVVFHTIRVWLMGFLLSG